MSRVLLSSPYVEVGRKSTMARPVLENGRRSKSVLSPLRLFCSASAVNRAGVDAALANAEVWSSRVCTSVPQSAPTAHRSTHGLG
jgi:hypothetical protein